MFHKNIEERYFMIFILIFYVNSIVGYFEFNMFRICGIFRGFTIANTSSTYLVQTLGNNGFVLISFSNLFMKIFAMMQDSEYPLMYLAFVCKNGF